MSERISIYDIINFIQKNITQISNIDCIDNTQLTNEIPLIQSNSKLTPLQFQEIKPIKSLPPNLNQIFNEKYFHIGVLRNLNKLDISLYSSIIVCLKSKFHSQTLEFQIDYITKFIDCLKSNSKIFNYKKYNWNKSDIYNSLCKDFIGINIIKFVSDYLYINIFILDIEQDKLYFGSGEHFIAWKKTIFLIKYNDNYFEPLYSETNMYFQHKDTIIQYILSNKHLVNLYQLSLTNTFEFTDIEENLNPYLHIKEQIETIYDDIIDNDVEYTEKTLKNMKLIELQKIASSKKIEIKKQYGKNKTKEELIHAILH